MTHHIRSTVIALSTCFTLSVLATPAGAQERCSDASLRGSYAFQVDGGVVDVVPLGGTGPFAAVGKNTYDGTGHMSGTITVNTVGIPLFATFTGTYSVREDCTGKKSAVLSNGAIVNFDFVIDDDLREVRMIVTDPGVSVSGTARKMVTDRRRRN